MNEFIKFLPVEVIGQQYTDVVVIRPPESVSEEELSAFVSQLSLRGLLPLVQPRAGTVGYDEGETGWYPTDVIREVGIWIFDNSIDELDDVMDFLRKILPDDQITNIERKIIRVPEVSGGNYVYHNPSKTFVYATNEISLPRNISSRMKSERWHLIPVDTSDTSLNGYEDDLDFLLSSPFLGRDGHLHVISASSFIHKVPTYFSTHEIPDSEAALGGCNIADCQNGRLLIAPHPDDAPATFEILQEFATVDIMTTPRNFLDGGGGPRCSISSFSL